jgi:hypothetical protein
MKLSETQFENLKKAFALEIVQEMDRYTLEEFALDTLIFDMQNYSTETLLAQVKEQYPELLENL